jgi:hypothetical protein
VSRFEHATHTGGCGFCKGLGITLRHGIRKVLSVVAGIGIGRHHTCALAQRLGPHRALLGRAHGETFDLDARARLAGSEVHAPVADQVERGDAFRHARGMVDGRQHVDDAVAQANLFAALAGRGEEYFGRGRVRVFLEEVMLDFPSVVEAQPVGGLDLRKRLFHQLRGRCAPRSTAGEADARRRFRTSHAPPKPGGWGRARVGARAARGRWRTQRWRQDSAL